jgi:hypothetical protein
MPKADDSLAAFFNENKKLIESKLSQVKSSRNADAVIDRMRLLTSCEELVKNHPSWLKETILSFFPEFREIIDLVMNE